jgi:hypothetical protein
LGPSSSSSNNLNNTASSNTSSSSSSGSHIQHHAIVHPTLPTSKQQLQHQRQSEDMASPQQKQQHRREEPAAATAAGQDLSPCVDPLTGKPPYLRSVEQLAADFWQGTPQGRGLMEEVRQGGEACVCVCVWEGGADAERAGGGLCSARC